MKFIVVLVGLFVIAAHAQAPRQAPMAKPVDADAPTALERTQLKYGAVTVKGTTRIGRVSMTGSVVIDAVEFREGTTRTKGLAVTVVDNDGRSTSSYVDYDEIDSLIRGIESVGKADSSVTTFEKYDVSYRTRGGLDVSVLTTEGGQAAFAVNAGRVARSLAFSRDKKQITEMLEYVRAAKSLLDTAK